MSAVQRISPASGTGLTLSVAPPDGTPRGGVVVGQMAFGVDPYLEGVCADLAAAGYLAVAPHLFWRTGGGTVAYDDLDGVRAHYGGISEDGLVEDLDSTVTWLREAGVDPSRLGAVGFCFGGRVSLLAALRGHVQAAVSFYPTGIVSPRLPQLPALVDAVAGLQAPWLGLFGARDTYVPAADVEAIRRAAERAAVEADVVVYETAGHGFHSTVHGHHDPAAASDGWSRTLDWFSRHLGGDGVGAR